MIDAIIAGVNLTMDAFFKFKESKSNSVKVEMTVNAVLYNAHAVALNISVINKSEKPFSILKMFCKTADDYYDALELTEIEGINSSRGTISYKFKTATFNFDFNNPDVDKHLAVPIFNTRAYLQPYQAETGWVVISVKDNKFVFSTFGIKISTSNEILYIAKD